MPQQRVFNKTAYFAETDYFPHAGQRIVHNDRHRHKVCCNGRRWGKTLLGGKEAETLAFVLNRLSEPNWVWIVGPEFKDCEKEFRVVYNTFKKLGIDKISTKFLNNVDNGNMVIKTKWGFTIECRSALHPETLVGEGLDHVLMVEAGRHKRKTWSEYIRPALSDKRGTSLHTGVPEVASEHMLLYHAYNRGQLTTTSRGTPNPWKSWRMPSWTNDVVFPGGRMDPEIVDAEDDLTADEFDRQYGAKFVDRIGRVMADWDDDVHLADLRYNPKWPLYSGVDFGYTNPFVWLWIQVDEFENCYVIRERRWVKHDAEEVAKDLLTHQIDGPLVRAMVAMYCDPAEPDDANILMKHLKKPNRGGTGGTIKGRLNHIWRLLKLQNPHLPYGSPEQRPSMLVDRTKCPDFVWEMREGYRWPEHKTDAPTNDKENPMDKDNHGPEAFGRFAQGYYGSINKTQSARQSKIRVGRTLPALKVS